MNEDLMAGSIELEAWQRSSRALKALGFEDGWDSEGLNEFHKTVVLWGECLSTLRRTQTVDQVMVAMAEALSQADQAQHSS